MKFHILVFTVLIACCLVANIVDGQGNFFTSTVISTLEKGTICHGYVTNCKGKVIFDKGTQDCSGNCTVSQRNNIPGNQPYCPHMVVHSVKGTKANLSINRVNQSACFEVKETSPEKFDFAQTKDCPNPVPDSYIWPIHLSSLIVNFLDTISKLF
ncbi:3867_t:CDS:2 [Dentiscutata erythropus]|uniref:3867_t:CDS:1 n=1 Tax=Dentiscutata erythropus TaxID=1348616 RepID=A0A9N8Z8E5_9GLOM|nr:3867_t:CDS:2 [Dentiscutata erythropus]